VLTCGSEKSRNFRFGAALATGAEIDPEMTVEGVHTARRLAADPDIDTPIADVVAAMADGRLDFRAALDTLLSRPLKPE
jgi:glycerol-3-phosphate dehydrogenase (NAD(P)+)